MGLMLELRKGDGNTIKFDLGGSGFIDKGKFQEILKTIKSLDERNFEPALKIWFAPLTEDNIKKIQDLISEEEYQKALDSID